MKRIIIVDDEDILAQVYREALAREGYEVEIAGCGAAALPSQDTLAPERRCPRTRPNPRRTSPTT